MLNHFNW